jgi:hypothetical protein
MFQEFVSVVLSILTRPNQARPTHSPSLSLPSALQQLCTSPCKCWFRPGQGRQSLVTAGQCHCSLWLVDRHLWVSCTDFVQSNPQIAPPTPARRSHTRKYNCSRVASRHHAPCVCAQPACGQVVSLFCAHSACRGSAKRLLHWPQCNSLTSNVCAHTNQPQHRGLTAIYTDQASKMLESIEAFGAENGVNAAALQSITRSWLSYLRAVQKNNAPPKAVRDDLVTMGECLFPLTVLPFPIISAHLSVIPSVCYACDACNGFVLVCCSSPHQPLSTQVSRMTRRHWSPGCTRRTPGHSHERWLAEHSR